MAPDRQRDKPPPTGHNATTNRQPASPTSHGHGPPEPIFREDKVGRDRWAAWYVAVTLWQDWAELAKEDAAQPGRFIGATLWLAGAARLAQTGTEAKLTAMRGVRGSGEPAGADEEGSHEAGGGRLPDLSIAFAAGQEAVCWQYGILGLNISSESTDVTRAAELYERAAELGVKEAHYNLGALYANGSDVEKDMAKAFRHYEAAAMCGHAPARHNVGSMEYNDGNYDLALQHWMISAKLGHEGSLSYVKRLFMEGLATKADYAAALRGAAAARVAHRLEAEDMASLFLEGCTAGKQTLSSAGDSHPADNNGATMSADGSPAASGPDTESSHYRLCKKVAQLTRVVASLNDLNERLSSEKDAAAAELRRFADEREAETNRRAENRESEARGLRDELAAEYERRLDENARDAKSLIDAHEAERTSLVGAHEAETAALRERFSGEAAAAEFRIASLEEELAGRSEELRIAAADHAAREAALRERHDDREAESAARARRLARDHEEELSRHLRTVRDVTASLEEQSRQAERNAACLRNELAEECRRKVSAVRAELVKSHGEELALVRSRHDSELRQAKCDAEEELERAVADAGRTTRLEYEGRIADLQRRHDEERQSAEECRRTAVKALEDELEDARREARKTEALERRIEEQSRAEQRLRVELDRLRSSLDGANASSRHLIDELQRQNEALSNDLGAANGAAGERAERIAALEGEVAELKGLVDEVDGARAELECSLEAMAADREDDRRRSAEELQERDAAIAELTSDLGGARRSSEDLDERLARANDEIARLAEFEGLAASAQTTIRGLRSGLEQTKAEALELNGMFASTVNGVAEWKARADEQLLVSKGRVSELDGKVSTLDAALRQSEAARGEAESAGAKLTKRIEHLEDTAESVSVARTGERLSYEQAVRDLTARHSKDQARLACLAQDEQDILNNKIHSLVGDMQRLREAHSSALSARDRESERRADEHEAEVSKLKYESSLQIQGQHKQIEQLTSKARCDEEELASLTRCTIDLREQLETARVEHSRELDSASERHQDELEGLASRHGKRVDGLEARLSDLRGEKDRVQALLGDEVACLKSHIADEQDRIKGELHCIELEFRDLKKHCVDQVTEARREVASFCGGAVSGKLVALRTTHDDALARHKDEVRRLKAPIFSVPFFSFLTDLEQLELPMVLFASSNQTAWSPGSWWVPSSVAQEPSVVTMGRIVVVHERLASPAPHGAGTPTNTREGSVSKRSPSNVTP
ncbi:hypothetical protein THAOC_14369 [Thalassiosira oceanica]|uniref:Uncharacterized protein n=1 Tax=Thalassiosira oceanica TaxID=159749 RepID=K0SFE7_THAOC|nr:hypothetical protein THAOC_14369 [Thalassiosira oceanica]|eukprot:EJK64853.1 hypothetical protein THAOC_14369 [Thalassiosira oceanica]